MNFLALADRQNNIWVTVRNGVVWLNESSKNNQVPCWACGAATPLAPTLQELPSVLLPQMKEDTLENHWAEKSQLCREFWTSLVGNLGQKKSFFQSFGLLACSFWLVSHNLHRISIYTPRPNQKHHMVVPMLGVSLDDAYSSGDGISKASSDKGHSYCSLQSPCCHKQESWSLLSAFTALTSLRPAAFLCGCVPVAQPVLPRKYKPSGSAFLGAGNLLPSAARGFTKCCRQGSWAGVIMCR